MRKGLSGQLGTQVAQVHHTASVSSLHPWVWGVVSFYEFGVFCEWSAVACNESYCDWKFDNSRLCAPRPQDRGNQPPVRASPHSCRLHCDSLGTSPASGSLPFHACPDRGPTRLPRNRHRAQPSQRRAPSGSGIPSSIHPATVHHLYERNPSSSAVCTRLLCPASQLLSCIDSQG